jgi:HEPN domain-containing protein
MNETAAKDWLNKAWHHYSSGKILYEANHYTDVIAIDLHYAVEVTLKTFLAYENKAMIKTHDLNELSLVLKSKILFSIDEQKLLARITKYHIKGSYPTMDRILPSRDEIKIVLDFALELYDKVCGILNIDEKSVKC